MVNVTIEELQTLIAVVQEFRNNLPVARSSAAKREEAELSGINEKLLTVQEHTWKGDVVVSVGCERETSERLTR